jgi:hypothetical protein
MSTPSPACSRCRCRRRSPRPPARWRAASR